MLHVIATPIGNLADLSPRALEAFKSAAVIACEDTRRTWQLLTHFGVSRPPEMFSYRQGNVVLRRRNNAAASNSRRKEPAETRPEIPPQRSGLWPRSGLY